MMIMLIGTIIFNYSLQCHNSFQVLASVMGHGSVPITVIEVDFTTCNENISLNKIDLPLSCNIGAAL